MSQQNDKNQIPVTGGLPGVLVAPPPPPGYPTRDGQQPAQNAVRIETKTRGDGFWKGCCAALCCACVLEACC